MALLYPDRGQLARTFPRLVQARWPFQGFADHGVSEAIYLADPEGNGLELYADRPRDRWPRHGSRLVMYTAPLDLDALVAAASVPRHPNSGPVVGHTSICRCPT